MTQQQHTAVQAGSIVRAAPIGQSRRQLIHVAKVIQADENSPEIVVGYLCSKKYPGDFRGHAAAWLADCEVVEQP